MQEALSDEVGGLGPIMCRMHDRAAVHQQYVVGASCQACGKKFHTARRLTTHLRSACHCCSKLAAMGQRRDEPAPRLRSWKRKEGDPVELCPPERTSAPAQVAPDESRIWKDVPLMVQARQQLLDWLVEFTGCDAETAVERLLEMVEQFPLHEHEVRILFQGLKEDMLHLLQVEQLSVWNEVGQDNLLSAIDKLAEHFRFSWVTSEPGVVETTSSEQHAMLQDHNFWLPCNVSASRQVANVEALQATQNPSPDEPWRLDVVQCFFVSSVDSLLQDN